MVSGINQLCQKLFAPITGIPAGLGSTYFTSLDGLRGIAIFIVVFSHLGGNLLIYPLHLAINSRTGVDLFFILSGFLITTLLLKEQVTKGKVSLRRFYIRRILRIVPAAYAFLLMLGILNAFFNLGIGVNDFITSLCFIKNLPVPNEPFTAHFWTLAVEVQFYLMFPALLLDNVNRYIIIALLLVIGIPAMAIFSEHSLTAHQPIIIHWLFKLSRYVFWKGPVIILIGSLLSIFIFKGIVPVKAIPGSSVYIAGLIILALIVTSRTFAFYIRYIAELSAAVLFSLAILFSLKGRDFLSSPLLTKVGLISYSIYVWQELFIGGRVWQSWLKFMDGYPVGALIVAKLALLFLISLASYYFIERLFLRLKNKFE